MRDYSKGKIYQIECLTTGKVYIGSTTKDYLSQRLTAHRTSYKRWKEGKHGFVTSFPILEGGNYEITLLELYPCQSCDELHSRERYWIESMKCILSEGERPKVVNRFIPTRTDKEYREANSERLTTYFKAYYEAHHERILVKKKEYRRLHNEQIQAQRNQKVVCECGGRYTQTNKKVHEKSTRHKDFVSHSLHLRTVGNF